MQFDQGNARRMRQKQKPWPDVAERAFCLLEKQKAPSSSTGVIYKQTEENPPGFQ